MNTRILQRYTEIINEATSMIKRYNRSSGIKMQEKWDKPTKVSPAERGKYEGKSKAQLLKSYNALKKSGPHQKDSPEYGRMRELAFAIRAKGGWGKVE